MDPLITLMSPDPRLTPANPLPPLSRPLRRILDPATALPLAPLPLVCCVPGFWILDCGLYPLERPGFWILYPGPSTPPAWWEGTTGSWTSVSWIVCTGQPTLGRATPGRWILDLGCPPARSRCLDPGSWILDHVHTFYGRFASANIRLSSVAASDALLLTPKRRSLPWQRA